LITVSLYTFMYRTMRQINWYKENIPKIIYKIFYILYQNV